LNDTLKISHLVVNGCSYTYGHGIIDPIQNAWASIIAKRLGVPLVNLALPGQGNTGIYRRTMQYFYKDLFNHNNPFYIHAYSQSTRREVYLATTQQFSIVGGDVEISELEKEIILNSDDYYYCLLQQDKLHRWASINHLLDAHNVPHLMSDYMPETNGTTVEFQEKHDTILKTELECHPGKLKDFTEVTINIGKTSCLHETEEGHAVLADYIWKEIENRYKNIEVVDLPHAKLHDILIHTPNSEADIEQSLTEINKNPIDYYPLDFSRNVYYFHELGMDYANKLWSGKPDIPETPC
jgi:hypothetical protein